MDHCQLTVSPDTAGNMETSTVALGDGGDIFKNYFLIFKRLTNELINLLTSALHCVTKSIYRLSIYIMICENRPVRAKSIMCTKRATKAKVIWR